MKLRAFFYAYFVSGYLQVTTCSGQVKLATS
jgi:hypothetical protein